VARLRPGARQIYSWLGLTPPTTPTRRIWRGATPTANSADAFAVYQAALDREEAAAHALQLHVAGQVLDL
jgi:hypothetical protein